MTVWPPPSDLPTDPPRRLVLHWTAGAHLASPLDRAHYHVLLEHREGDPSSPDDDQLGVVRAVPVANNCRDLSAGDPTYADDPERGYGAHVRGFNSWSVGLSACAMRGAVDRRPGGKVDPGPDPLTRLQVRGFITWGAEFCLRYDYRPTPERVFTHAEAERLHGVPQRNNWDPEWVPGLNLASDAVGPWFRSRIADYLDTGEIEYGRTETGETQEGSVDRMEEGA